MVGAVVWVFVAGFATGITCLIIMFRMILKCKFITDKKLAYYKQCEKDLKEIV